MRQYFQVKDNKTKDGFLDRVVSYLERLRDGEYILEIVKTKNQRTAAQNRLYWKWLSLISDYTGYTKEEMHEYFKQEYLPSKEVLGKQIPKSTTDLDTKGFTDYLKKIEQMTKQYNIKLPTIRELDF